MLLKFNYQLHRLIADIFLTLNKNIFNLMAPSVKGMRVNTKQPLPENYEIWTQFRSV